MINTTFMGNQSWRNSRNDSIQGHRWAVASSTGAGSTSGEGLVAKNIPRVMGMAGDSGPVSHKMDCLLTVVVAYD